MRIRPMITVLATFVVAGAIGCVLVANTHEQGNHVLDLGFLAWVCFGLAIAIFIYSAVRGQRALDRPEVEDPSRNG